MKDFSPILLPEVFHRSTKKCLYLKLSTLWVEHWLGIGIDSYCLSIALALPRHCLSIASALPQHCLSIACTSLLCNIYFMYDLSSSRAVWWPRSLLIRMGKKLEHHRIGAEQLGYVDGITQTKENHNWVVNFNLLHLQDNIQSKTKAIN